MSHWTTRRLLTSLSDLLANAIGTARGEDVVRVHLQRRYAEWLAAAANAAATSTDPLLDEPPPALDMGEEEES